MNACKKRYSFLKFQIIVIFVSIMILSFAIVVANSRNIKAQKDAKNISPLMHESEVAIISKSDYVGSFAKLEYEFVEIDGMACIAWRSVLASNRGLTCNWAEWEKIE